jgi:DNA-binding protein H-NS
MSAEAERAREAKLGEAKQALIEEMRAKAALLGITVEALVGTERRRRQRSDAGKKLAVRYRGPKGEEWAGRGPTPRWLRTLEAAGKKRGDFEVKM